jgi:DNA damage-inducible protein 1
LLVNIICRILGRVHLANLKVGGSFFGCSFTILERNDVDLLFGLDMLKRHQCLIDLRENCLHIGSGNVKVPFLAEKDLPDSAKEKQNDMEPVGELPPPNAAAEDGKPPAAASDPPAPPAPADLQIEKVQQLVSLGIPREQATLALESVGGDVDQAAAFFFAQMEV